MFEIVVLFLSVFIGALIVDKFNVNKKVLSLLLAFSGAYLLAIAFTHILPDVFSGSNSQQFGYFILGGFFTQIIIEYISGGAEHGHGHCESNNHKHNDNSIIKISPYGLLIGISIHAFFEGMPFSHQFHACSHSQDSLLLGIIVHKLPIAIVLMGLFLASGYSKVKAYSLITIFALAAPAGALLSGVIGESLGLEISYFYKIVMALLVGIFLHISTSIIFESNTTHRFNFYKLLTIIVGIGTAILSDLL